MATKTVFLLVEKNGNGESKTYWNRAGVAFENRDGSLNLRLDLFPTLTFNIRESREREQEEAPEPPKKRGK
jgi:hypothetical protein